MVRPLCHVAIDFEQHPGARVVQQYRHLHDPGAGLDAVSREQVPERIHHHPPALVFIELQPSPDPLDLVVHREPGPGVPVLIPEERPSRPGRHQRPQQLGRGGTQANDDLATRRPGRLPLQDRHPAIEVDVTGFQRAGLLRSAPGQVQELDQGQEVRRADRPPHRQPYFRPHYMLTTLGPRRALHVRDRRPLDKPLRLRPREHRFDRPNGVVPAGRPPAFLLVEPGRQVVRSKLVSRNGPARVREAPQPSLVVSWRLGGHLAPLRACLDVGGPQGYQIAHEPLGCPGAVQLRQDLAQHLPGGRLPLGALSELSLLTLDTGIPRITGCPVPWLWVPGHAVSKSVSDALRVAVSQWSGRGSNPQPQHCEFRRRAGQERPFPWKNRLNSGLVGLYGFYEIRQGGVLWHGYRVICRVSPFLRTRGKKGSGVRLLATLPAGQGLLHSSAEGRAGQDPLAHRGCDLRVLAGRAPGLVTDHAHLVGAQPVVAAPGAHLARAEPYDAFGPGGGEADPHPREDQLGIDPGQGRLLIDGRLPADGQLVETYPVQVALADFVSTLNKSDWTFRLHVHPPWTKNALL